MRANRLAFVAVGCILPASIKLIGEADRAFYFSQKNSITAGGLPACGDGAGGSGAGDQPITFFGDAVAAGGALPGWTVAYRGRRSRQPQSLLFWRGRRGSVEERRCRHDLDADL